ncbi:hypothetical protein C8R44DRAFT_749937 [Mycena epipterygia]|nr:hypothetical protein C8R44DRAFT_749937 [Mycena epipterygia]
MRAMPHVPPSASFIRVGAITRSRGYSATLAPEEMKRVATSSLSDTPAWCLVAALRCRSSFPRSAQAPPYPESCIRRYRGAAQRGMDYGAIATVPPHGKAAQEDGDIARNDCEDVLPRISLLAPTGSRSAVTNNGPGSTGEEDVGAENAEAGWEEKDVLTDDNKTESLVLCDDETRGACIRDGAYMAPRVCIHPSSCASSVFGPAVKGVGGGEEDNVVTEHVEVNHMLRDEEARDWVSSVRACARAGQSLRMARRAFAPPSFVFPGQERGSKGNVVTEHPEETLGDDEIRSTRSRAGYPSRVYDRAHALPSLRLTQTPGHEVQGGGEKEEEDGIEDAEAELPPENGAAMGHIRALAVPGLIASVTRSTGTMTRRGGGRNKQPAFGWRGQGDGVGVDDIGVERRERGRDSACAATCGGGTIRKSIQW